MGLNNLKTPSKFLAATDLTDPNDGDEFLSPTVTIASVGAEKVGESEKGVMRFANVDKALVLKDTIIDQLVEIFGTDDEQTMIGKRVTLYVTDQPYQGKIFKVIRVKKAKAKVAVVAPTPPPLPAATIEDDEGGLPF